MPAIAAQNPTPTRAKPPRKPVMIDDKMTSASSRSRKLKPGSPLFLVQRPPRQGAISFLVFLAGAQSNVLGKCGSRRLLVPVDRLQIVADVLFVVGRLGAARLILVSRPEAG